ncbi:hypothetical protein [Anaerobacillus alkaliphilus]|nr:hypothetical protein [Anaerobacillus alkaliphilus]
MTFKFLFFTIKLPKRNNITRATDVEAIEENFEDIKRRYLYTQRLL